jgi:MFS family permease
VRRDLTDSWLHPGTRLGLWSHFTVQFSGIVFALLWGFPFMTQGLGLSESVAGTMLTVLVLAGMAAGPVLGRLTASFPLRRSNLVLGVVTVTVMVWSAVLAWPGAAPLPLVVLLVLVLSLNGPASMVGFDFARTFNPSARLGSATGIVNVGGFVASLLAILGVGLLLDLRAPDGDYGLDDFKVAFSVQYLLWAVGGFGIWRTRVLARRGLRAAGTQIDPLPRAIVRKWDQRRNRP